jgi:serine/threonine protein kinase
MRLKKLYIGEQKCRVSWGFLFIPVKCSILAHNVYSYHPPEITARHRIDRKSTDLFKCDVWALGLLCWEIMRGGLPYYEDKLLLELLVESDPAHSQSSLGSLTTPNTHGSTADAVLKNLAIIQPHLKSIARQFTANRLRLDIPDFSRHMLTKHFELTLERDPRLRPGDISSLPLKYGVL